MTEFIEHQVNGQSFLVPEGDDASLNYFTGTDEVNIGVMLDAVPKDRNGIAVQAGGNLGYFPNAFSNFFNRVLTFEPDPINFFCLAHNCVRDNIVKMQAALGSVPEWIEIEIPDRRHVGLNQVKVGGKPKIPTVRIDDLGLPSCDFIQLDLEGYEYFALKGAEETIKKFRPILAVELVGHTGQYGVDPAEIRRYIEHDLGYQQVEHIFNDVVFTPV